MSVEVKIAAQAATKVAGPELKSSQVNTAVWNNQSSFSEVLEKYGFKEDGSNVGLRDDEIMQALGHSPRVSPADNAVSASGIQVDATNFPQLNTAQPNDKIANMLTEVNRTHLRMDDIINYATSAESLSNKDLIFLQAAMSKMTVQADLFSKITDGFSRAVRGLVERGGA